jgi:transcriptional regulator with XRE-family HTH domain
MKNRLIIIDALETAREAQGVTQAELASRAGTSRVTVGRIEAGFDPKLSTFYELARALGLELTLVPKSLAGEVQAFLRSGGRSLAQPVGASAPPSVVDLAAVATARPRLKAGLATVAHQATQQSKPAPRQKADHATVDQQPLPSSTKRSGKPQISASAALALGLNSQLKISKATKNTKGGQ